MLVPCACVCSRQVCDDSSLWRCSGWRPVRPAILLRRRKVNTPHVVWPVRLYAAEPFCIVLLHRRIPCATAAPWLPSLCAADRPAALFSRRSCLPACCAVLSSVQSSQCLVVFWWAALCAPAPAHAYIRRRYDGCTSAYNGVESCPTSVNLYTREADSDSEWAPCACTEGKKHTRALFFARIVLC